MPDQGLMPPYLDPEQYPNYLDMQKKQMLAQMLMGNSQAANQTPDNWNSMKVVPKRSPLQSLTSVADALLAGKALKSSMGAQQKYFEGLYGGGQPSSSAPSSAPASGAAPQQLNSESSSNPMIPGNLDRRSAQGLLSMMGPEKYAESIVAPNLKPAEIRAQIRAAGIHPDSVQGRRMALSALNKSTTNLQDVRPGGTLFDVNQGKPIFTGPQNGVQTQWSPDGPTQSTVPGAPAAQAQMTGAETAGKTMNTPQTLPTAGGGSTVAYPSDVIGTPPALRDQPGAPATAAPKNYFPTPATAEGPKTGPWSTIPKLQVSKALGAPDDFTKGVLQESGKKHAELSTKYGNEADLADQKLQYNAESMKALPNAEVGPLSEWLTEHRAKLAELGLPNILGGSGTITPTMELNKNLKQSALQGARAIFGSRMTQMEVRLQHEELSPSTSMTRDAIMSLMQQDNIKQQYAKQRSTDYGKYVQQGGDPLRFESWYSKTFPLTKFASKATTPSEAVDRVTKNPSLLPDFKSKYGWDPTE